MIGQDRSRCRPRRGPGRGSARRSTSSRDTRCLRFTVHYRFHPLHGRELEAVVMPRREDGVVTVEDSAGVRLKIPRWMLLPDAARLTIAAQASVALRPLLAIVELLADLLPQAEPGPDPKDYDAPSSSEGSNAEGNHEAARTRVRKRVGGGKRSSARSRDSGAVGDVDGTSHRGSGRHKRTTRRTGR